MARFTIDFTPEAESDLKEIQKALRVNTKSEVIRKALNLVNFVVREQEKGGRLIVENERDNSRKEIVTI